MSERSILLLLLLSILPGMLGRYTSEPKGGTAILLTDILVLLFTFFWSIKKWLRNEWHIPHMLFWILGLFWVVLFISWIQGFYIVSRLGDIDLKEMISSGLYLGRFLAYSLIGLICFDALKQFADIEFWEKTFRWIFFGIILGGFLQLIFYPDFFEFFVLYGWDPHKDRLLGTFFDPNFIGAFLAMNLLFFLSIEIHTPSYSFWNYFLWIAGLIALGLTLSRSAYLAFLTGFIILTLFRARWILIVGIFSLMILIPAVPSIAERITQGVSVDDSSKKHIESWHEATLLISAYPVFGVGYNHLPAVQDYLGLADEWDVNNRSGFENSFLSTLVYSGIIGFCIYLFFWFQVLRVSWHNMFDSHTSPYIRGIVFGIFSGIIAAIISAFFINTLYFAFIVIELWMWLGILAWIDEKRHIAVSSDSE